MAIQNRFIRGIFLWAACALSLTGIGFTGQAAAEEDGGEMRTVRILTIGNSFAENACYFLPQIGRSVNVRFVISRANRSGCSLETHWKRAELNQQDPENPDGKYGTPGTPGHLGLKDKLTEDSWDFVTIQQFSVLSHDAASYQPWADNLVEMVRLHAPQAKLMVHQTWAYRADSPRFNGHATPGAPTSQKQMHEELSEAYYALAKRFGAGILPSGDAVYAADNDPVWGFKPDPDVDPASFSPPSLPAQVHSLHTGYHWQKNQDGTHRLVLDPNHCGRAGIYLTGLVWLQTLTGIDATAVTFAPEGLEEDYAEFLRQTASLAVTRSQGEDASPPAADSN